MVRKHNLKLRERTMPATGVKLGLESGKVYDSKDVPHISLAEGVLRARGVG